MTDLPYYFGSLSSQEAEDLLKDKPLGTFLIRDSSVKQYSFIKQPYTISWSEVISDQVARRVWHMRVEYKNKRFNLEDEIDSFPTIDQLVKYYSKERYPLSPKCYSPMIPSLQQLSVNSIKKNDITVPFNSLVKQYKL